MVKSTSSLISEQCNHINLSDPNYRNKSKRRVHNILSEQIASLNSTSNYNTEPINIVSLRDELPLPVPIKTKKSSRHKSVSRCVDANKRKSSDNNFIQLLAGTALSDSKGNAIELDPVTKLKQQISQSHVMKSLGGFKFLESNLHDNFVVTIIPRLENNSENMELPLKVMKEEIGMAYKLTIENDNKFTKELFQENIQKFRNLLQSSAPYSAADFPNFLRKLSSSKLFGIHLDNFGNQIGILRDSAIVDVLCKLQPPDYLVYCTIESAGNRGIWTADIRKITGLLIHQVQRAVKNLCDGVRLIKPVTNIHHKNRKLYILANLEPSIEITGGSFYLNGEFNEVLVEKLQEQIGLFLSKNQGSTLMQITQYLKSSDIIQGELLDKDVSSVVKLLILEDKIYSAPINNSSDSIYIWCGGSTIEFADQAFGIPCFKCDVYKDCNLGKYHAISPVNYDPMGYIEDRLKNDHVMQLNSYEYVYLINFNDGNPNKFNINYIPIVLYINTDIKYHTQMLMLFTRIAMYCRESRRQCYIKKGVGSQEECKKLYFFYINTFGNENKWILKKLDIKALPEVLILNSSFNDYISKLSEGIEWNINTLSDNLLNFIGDNIKKFEDYRHTSVADIRERDGRTSSREQHFATSGVVDEDILTEYDDNDNLILLSLNAVTKCYKLIVLALSFSTLIIYSKNNTVLLLSSLLIYYICISCIFSSIHNECPNKFEISKFYSFENIKSLFSESNNYHYRYEGVIVSLLLLTISYTLLACRGRNATAIMGHMEDGKIHKLDHISGKLINRDDNKISLMIKFTLVVGTCSLIIYVFKYKLKFYESTLLPYDILPKGKLINDHQLSF